VNKNTLAPRSLALPCRLLCVATVAFGGWLAYKQAFAGVAEYDDEGYLLLSLLNYVKHGGLYTATFAQYGPFYFYAQQMMHLVLHLPLNHDGARTLTLLYWLLSSLLSLCFIFRVTRNLPLASVCFLVSLETSKVLHYEPGHPQEIILVLVQSAILLSLFTRGRWSAQAFLGIGAIAALLCLTKINVGIFFSFAVLMSCIAVLVPSAWQRVVLITASLAAIVLPVVLMHIYLKTWALHYCLMAVGCIGALSVTSASVRVRDPISTRQLILLLSGVIAVSIAILLFAIGQGTSLRSLLDGIVLLPLRHPAVFYIVFLIPGGRFLLVALLLLLTASLWMFRDKLKSHPGQLGTLKVLMGAVALATLWHNFPLSILIVLPLLPVLYLDATREMRPLEWMLPRCLLSFIVGFEFLQAYPVAGSQMEIALTPGVAWACLMVFDGISAIAEGHYALHPLRRHALAISLVLQATLIVLVSYSSFNIRTMGPTLDLPGAKHIHVSNEEAITYRTLVREIRQGCDTLFTMPGMGSLNLWSERPTPNGYNLSAWMTAFTDDEQQAIVDILRRTNRPCVVYNEKLLHYWMPSGTARLSSSPLAKYVFYETRPISQVSDYELRVPMGSNNEVERRPSGI
jgi:hypothetical protein